MIPEEADIFDSLDVQIGDEGVCTADASRAAYSLRSTFRKILSPPIIPANLSLTPEEQWQVFREGSGQEWWKAWQTQSNRGLHHYLALIHSFPEIFLDTPWLAQRSKGTIPYQILKIHYQAIATWMFCLTTPGCRVSDRWKLYEPYGLLAMSMLNVCKAVFSFKKEDNIFHGARGLFASPEHLWFWCTVAGCLQKMRTQGLTHPIVFSNLKNKADVIAEMQCATQFIKDRSTKDIDTFCSGWRDFIENLDRYLIAEAVKGYYLEGADSDQLDDLVKVREHVRNRFRRSKDYQVHFLYCFSEDTPPRTFVTAQSKKLPKREQRTRRD